jgi:Protein of unknown function (DUF2568)
MGSRWNAVFLTAAFVSEIAALVVLGYWGFTLDGPLALRIAVGVGAPALAAVVWGLFAAPKAPVRVLGLAILVKVAVFGSAVWALLATRHPWLALALAVLAVLGSVLSSAPTDEAPSRGSPRACEG